MTYPTSEYSISDKLLRRRRRGFWIVVALVFVACLSLGVAKLYHGHPHEDAFILFRYADNMSAGRGIVYNAGGPPVEGSTDFLWLVLIAGLGLVGVDPAVAAAFLNAIGAAVAAAIVLSVVYAVPPSLTRRIVATVSVLAVLCSAPVAAGMMGFSTPFYSTVMLCLFWLLIEGRSGRRSLALVPPLAVLVALIRPDGLPPAAAASVMAGIFSVRRGQFRAFCRTCVVASLVGAAYFVWRWHYFGLVLPLPLYVKSHGPAWSGLSDNLRWLVTHPRGPRYLLLFIILMAASRRHRKHLRELGLFAIPLLCFLVALSFAEQTQNIFDRFQAPVTLVLLYLVVRFWRDVARQGRAAFPTVCLVLCLLITSIAWGARILREVHSPPTSFDTAVAALGKACDSDSVVALTEAGALAYWSDAKVEDIVGLNCPHFARTPATAEHVSQLKPDFVFFHAKGITNRNVLEPGPAVVEVRHDVFARVLKKRYQPLFEQGGHPTSFSETGDLTNVEVAQVALARFLATAQNYRIYLIHKTWFMGINKACGKSKEFVRITMSFFLPGDDARYRARSYAAIKGFWFVGASGLPVRGPG